LIDLISCYFSCINYRSKTASFSIGDSVLALQAHPEFNKDFSLKLLYARKSSIEPAKYLEAINELETLEHDGELITPNIINFLEQKF
jgi:hypothetical protein